MGAGNQHLPLRAKLCYLLSLGSISNFVYLFYACFTLYIDFGSSAEAASQLVRARNHTAAALGLPQSGQDDYYYEEAAGDAYTLAIARTHRLAVAAAAVHLGNAFMYALVWPLGGAEDPATGRPWSFFAWVQYPELFNIIEASLVVYASSEYDREKTTGVGRYLDAVTLANHKVALAAALAQLAAALGWCHVFWHTHERVPGCGLTPDDPELLALVFVLAPSILYVAYYASVAVDPMNYRNFRINAVTSALFESGDVLYFLGAFMYAVTSFRDSGFFGSLGVSAGLRAGVAGACARLRARWGGKAPAAAALELRAAAAPPAAVAVAAAAAPAPPAQEAT